MKTKCEKQITSGFRLTALAAAITLSSAVLHAQESSQEETGVERQVTIEEIIAIGRQKSGLEDLFIERQEQAVAVDVLGYDQISRVGDSNVAAALRRVPGITLVNDKFVYVRGLGERYSSNQLNGASVPSPDLTRNVVPLDIFPSNIIQSLSVQKVFSPDMPAAFGGGGINIRTKSIPDGFVATLQGGVGWNSESSGDGISYSGGDDDYLGKDDGSRELPLEVRNAIGEYQGNISPFNILTALNRDGGTHTLAEAEAINRQIGGSLNRDIGLKDESLGPDYGLQASLGNRWEINDEISVGALAVGAYENKWRNKERVLRNVSNPENYFSNTQRTVNEIGLTLSANFGITYLDDHRIDTTSMLLRSTEDEASLTTGFSANFELANGSQFRNMDLRFEHRDLIVNQVRGTHTLGYDTLNKLGLSNLDFIEGLEFSWYYSDSVAKTDIPNEVAIEGRNIVDASGQVVSTSVVPSATAASFIFTDLQDDVINHGWDLSYPFETLSFRGEIAGGFDYTRKGREYYQYNVNISTANAGSTLLTGLPEEVFADDNILNSSNGFSTGLGGLGSESYLAGQIVDGYYGKFDVTWKDTWRLAGGVRWEQFQQVSMPYDPLNFGEVETDPENLRKLVFIEDQYYPALALTYMLEDFWAERFQFRIGYGLTTVRPDLREISQATYIDPLTDFRVAGNSGLVTSELDNYDLRAEWFFANGDNLTLSLFYKDISKPIETVQGNASDDNILLTFINAQTAELYGAEIEWLKDLAFIGALEGFFLSGNVTISDSEIDIISSNIGLTNNTRRMTGHSDYVANVQLNYDSDNGKHAVSLAYNVFGERISFAGVEGAGDAFEQPFNSVDLVYTYFPTDNSKIKFKFKNLLNEMHEIEQDKVAIFEQEAGLSASVDFEWEF